MTSSPFLDNEPDQLSVLSDFDRLTWWIGAIARESAQVDLTVYLILRAILQNDPEKLN